ncbi:MULTISPECIES: DUF4255 domain-containing protein [Actinosynnema]|uniref:DUF4255 domain-containing protein n=1 Tax=Actinosynnema TaxID=40566 RepID=UPI0020A35889|nr:DUF4255 domain-containing protein [Actinosynnema pretiosum]MCP2099880.1 Protein of unknown function (DUF4255) [Actinosynnema pretiosum]
MIHEVDEAIRRLFAAGGVPAGGSELVFDAPTTEWNARRNAPTVNVFLYDIREDVGRRHAGGAERRDERGVVVGWRAPARWFELSYLVTAWTNRPQDEHRLLSEVLACLVRNERMAPSWLTGTLAELNLSVTLTAARPVREDRATAEVWSALGGELKPSIDLKVISPLAGEWTDAGPPVTEGVVLRTSEQAHEDPRRLRYDGPSRAEGEGFGARRSRLPVAGSRRRRGRLT